MEEKWPVAEVPQHDHHEHQRLISTSKWTTAWHHGVEDTLLNTHLHSFDSPIAMEEEQFSLEMPTWRTGDHPAFSTIVLKAGQKQPFFD